MDNPIEEIRGVVSRLCTGNRAQQKETLETYFTRDASFKHPFCAVTNDRDTILRIFQWYKILSPKIEISVTSVAFDPQNEVLYLNISQTFKIWFIPFYAAPVNLTTVLHLVEGHNTRGTVPLNDKYYIQSQEDLYQTDEFVKFFLPFRIGTTIVGIWQWIATLFCVMGAIVLGPIMVLFGDVKVARDEAAVVSDRLLANGEATETEQRRDSKRAEEAGEEKSGNLVEEGTVRKRDKGNGSKKSVREMERKANLGETK